MNKISLLVVSLFLSTSFFVYGFGESKLIPSATCTGANGCKACKNCKYCKHCAKEGGSCGVCK